MLPSADTLAQRQLPTDLSVEQLAEQCRVSVRLVRAHQSRRLLHPPRRVGRRSVYDHSHIDRLELIQRLQRAGFSLAAIRALLQTGHNAPELALAWHAEGLAMRFPSPTDTSDPDLQVEPEGVADLHAQPGAWEALESYGLVSRAPDGNWHGTHPVLVAVGRRAREMGLPSTEITRLQLRVAAAALELSREILEAFTPIFALRAPAPRPGDDAAENGLVSDRTRLIEDYAGMSSVATALVSATFEVQLSRVVRGVVGIPSAPV
ncbi:MerR family transcriptional regulator [Cryptosporangium aurantiacum]|uniref:MerR HTH family regulatory protein n=1 Tax=Cryptosporangium aurantiacum TaxID=134849 RepID=A0A1M7NIT4_9ACTN|nr:MerR family transcriptional regulator [Cryptosporangium aurantiacum]SHN03744.1 MerR HTH family regulatory protein [Cryptosporangium aurantiacum]